MPAPPCPTPSPHRINIRLYTCDCGMPAPAEPLPQLFDRPEISDGTLRRRAFKVGFSKRQQSRRSDVSIHLPGQRGQGAGR
jgi:hypothetical protein